MKTRQIISVSAILLMMALSTAAFAQKGPHNGNGKQNRDGSCQMDGPCDGIPNLTEEQQTQIKALMINHMKDVQVLQNKLGELKARQRSLTTIDTPDMKAVNANIDEITKVENDLMKKKVAHQIEVRKLLTDEQKIWFDSRGHGKMHRGFEGGPDGKGCQKPNDAN